MILSASDFRGDWRLSRTITDRLGGMDGTLSGIATFAGAGQALTYDETGRLALASGAVMEATRRYHWHFGGDRVDVTFADGAAFHGFVLGGVVEGTTHLCGADLYDVTYDFTGWPVWTATYVVRGPRKDYTSFSTYRPA